MIGGGAAGMMAAYSAATGGAFDEVRLIEKNEKLGKKVYITGKGRCNVTNDCDPETFFDNVVTNPKFLYSSYYGFDNTALMKLIEENGCPLKTERGNRVFPVSDHSSDILRAMNNALKDAGVKISLNTTVSGIVVSEDNGIRHVTGVSLNGGEIIKCDRVILATGSLSYPSTGSTGDGHKWLKKLGHTVTECRPALVPLVVKEADECAAMQGLALKNVSVSLYGPTDGSSSPDEHRGRKNKPVYQGFGEMLFTHFGVSGPLILSASSRYVKNATKTGMEDAVIHIDLKPALSEEQLDDRILRDFEGALNKDFRNVLGGLLPSSMIPVIIGRSGIPADKKIHDITKEERLKLVRCIKNYTLHITGTRDYNEAIITQGGVSVREINPSTLESKLVAGLFLAGEILDVDAYTGGFNLQIAWSTGCLAGR